MAVIMVFLVLLDSSVTMGFHIFFLYLWQRVCIDSANNYSYNGYVMVCNFNSSCDCWVCWYLLGTGFWKCNYVFDPGVCGFSKLLCTTDERIASCAGHHFVVWSFGWLCTTGTDSLFCADNLYWLFRSQMSLMSNETVLVINTRFIHIMFIIWRHIGCIFMAGIVTFVVLFVNWWGYEVVCVSRSCASFVWIFWYSNVNFPCTLFPCSKFSHRVFIWQGFLTRQGFWMIEDLMIHPFPDLMLNLLIWMHSFDQAFWCCYDVRLLWRLYLLGLYYELCFILLSASFLYLRLSIYAFYDCLGMVMFGAPLVDSFGVPHVFRVLKWS